MAVSEHISSTSRHGTALVRCQDYDPANVRSAIRQALELAGHPEQFIKSGDRILLKPNMLSAKEPEKAVTTHPEVITAVGEIVLDCGGKVILGDSPAGQPKSLEKYWQKTGMAEAAKRLGIELVSFESGRTKSFSTLAGHVNISCIALEADGIINLPKLKTHTLTRMTGAVKNMFGTVPGFRKGHIHSLAPAALPFSRYIVAVYQHVKPDLNIMDAVIGMEGNGPSAGKPKHVGTILVSQDAFAIDNAAARIMNMNKSDLPIFQAAEEAGLWDGAEDNLFIGGELSDFTIDDFVQPDVSRIERLPKFVQKSLSRLVWIRPKAEPKLCTACELCVDNCPEKAMEMNHEIPRIDYDKCIKCGCCDEVCQDGAIYQEMSLLAKLLA
ncbi:hypothetical protein CEE37_10615 [candidate division LCP-89 bacterium B3_LCP]|uniref:4Fe-4S ferredoxin-type domain-containing protein n=1 Tax=candidate division LCP-89 bacterium B3_LCP TaxID=2012998 RepID=A0A532UXQ7_UNCL8|nr:MAG: hypothetical protein CEE37_10615 [candidate division LCP-89 bacterium B3_LCP]